MFKSSVLIMGMGVEGISMLEYLVRSSFMFEIGIGDDRPLSALSPKLEDIISGADNVVPLLDGAYRSQVERYKIIVKSPGIYPSLLKRLHIPYGDQTITSPTEIFFKNCKGTIVGISGTKGKSTTSSLIYAIFREAGKNVHLVGNIGQPALSYLASHDNDIFFIYELSSYQLNDTKRSPDTAVLLNIIPEHLDYHGNFDSYIQAKSNIFRFQTEENQFVVNADCMNTRRLLAKEKVTPIFFSMSKKEHCQSAFYVEDNTIIDGSHPTQPISVIDTNEVPLLGNFNVYNVLAAVAVSRLYGIDFDAIKNAIRKFAPLEHRLEHVGTVSGITFYNDSISTIPQTTIEALNALGNGVETLIVGGNNRGVDYMPLVKRIIDSNITNLILFPETGLILEQAIKKACSDYKNRFVFFHTKDMAEAIKITFSYTERGKICVLSPASSSHGIFENFRERGHLFKKYIKEYHKESNNEW